MKKFQVFTDSTADLVKADREAVGLEYVRMSFTIDGKEYPADLDWSDLSPAQYYGMMRAGKVSKTSLVTMEEFDKRFAPVLEKGEDILYIACSSKLSGSVNNARLAAEELLENYPERRIVAFDSLRSNYAEGMMALRAAKMASEGKTLDETVAALEEDKLCYQVHATVGSLEWLKKAGRVKASTAFFGNLFGVKPIILSDAKGNNYGYKKVKGRKTSLDELVSVVATRIKDKENAVVYVEHADCEADANYVAENIRAKVAPKEVKISSVGPIIGATVGPDTITVNFYGEKVTIAGEE